MTASKTARANQDALFDRLVDMRTGAEATPPDGVDLVADAALAGENAAAVAQHHRATNDARALLIKGLSLAGPRAYEAGDVPCKLTPNERK